MTPVRIFVSSVQRDFAAERVALHDYLLGDPLLRRFFDVLEFEHVPATNRRPDELYVGEVERYDLDAEHFGSGYRFEHDHGLSPTEHELDRATEAGAQCLILVKATRRNPATPSTFNVTGHQGPELERRQPDGTKRPHLPNPGRLRSGGVLRAMPT